MQLYPLRATKAAGRRAVLAIVASVAVLAAGSGVALPAQAARAPSPASKGARDLPGLTSPAPPSPLPEMPVVGTDPANIPQPGTQGPKSRPSAFDPARSAVIEAETTATSKVYANPDGSRTAALSPAPVRFQDAGGRWTDIDLNLVTGADGTLGARASRSTARLSPRGDAIVAVIDTDAGPIGLRHSQATAAAGIVDGRQTTYRGALGGRDLALELVGDGVEEKVVLADSKASTSYASELILPVGVTARNGANGGVELLSASGAVVATFAQGMAYDSSRGAGVPGALGPVSVRLAADGARPALPDAAGADLPAGPRALAERTAKASSVVTVDVSVDPVWAADPARVLPLTIDPLLQATFNAATPGQGYDAWIYTGDPNDYSASTNLGVGTTDGGSHIARSVLYFYLDALSSSTTWVVESHLSMFNWSSASTCGSRDVSLFGLGAATRYGQPLNWANQAVLDGPGLIGPVSTRSFARTTGAACGGGYENLDATSLVSRWLNTSEHNYGLEVRAGNEADTSAFKWFYAAESGAGVAPVLSITYTHQPNAPVASGPADTSVITTTTPTLSVLPATDPDGDAVQYWFRVTTTLGAETGVHVADSGFTPSLSYTLKPGALADGVTYWWDAWTYDGNSWQESPWSRWFTVDLGLGQRPGTPTDGVGPVSVNLASGNLSTGFASPSFATVGGPVGLSYVYNSAAPPSNSGLIGSYYSKQGANADPATHDIVAGDVPALIRQDPTVYGSWNGLSPGPGLGTTDYTVRWKGLLAVPAGGSWFLGASHDEGVRIWVNGVLVLDKWTATPGNDFGLSAALSANTPVAIQVDYYQHTGDAGMILLAKGPGTETYPGGYVFPGAGWLTTEPSALPVGWSVSPTVGSGAASATARTSDGAVTVTDASGASHLYKAAGGGFTPPADEDGVLARDKNGRLALAADDGVTYAFNTDGTLASATSATDDRNPAAPCYASDLTDRLRGVTDPVSKRTMTLSYGGDVAGTTSPNLCISPTATMPKLACPGAAPPNLAVAPSGKLCLVSYWDGTSSKLWYNSGGQLARVEDPGNPTPGPPLPADSPPKTDFAYDTLGRLSSIRSPLVVDAAERGVIDATADAAARSEVTYDALGKVSALKAPNPTTTGTLRPEHRYTYTPVSGSPVTQTDVRLVGGDESQAPFARRIGFDNLVRAVTDTDATNATTTTTWDDKNRPTSVTDAAGRTGTVAYDAAGRRAETYGPATTSCFTGLVPNATCTNPQVHQTTTAYDGAIAGLAATYWANRFLAGAPVLHRTGVGPASGDLVADWTAAGPDPALGASWSGRFTGDIWLGAASNLRVLGGTSPALLVDDVTVTDTAVVTAGLHRVQVDYVPGTTLPATSALALQRRPAGTGTFANVVGNDPATLLSPRYGLPTTTTVHDTTTDSPPAVTVTAYGTVGGWPDPAAGRPTSTVVDPTGAALTTTTAYEPTGTGNFLRPVSHTLPAGNTTTYANYGLTGDLSPAVCGRAAGVDQGGLPKLTSAPSPDGGTTPGRTTSVVYDAAGRVVASHVNNDPWTCVTYDARGRVLTSAVPAIPLLSTPARTTTFTWTGAANDPRTASVNDGTGPVATTVDLLGRVVSYTDAWANLSASAYDQLGRLTDTVAHTGLLGTATSSRHTAYDPAGRPTLQSLDATTVATATYSPAGELTGAIYANGTALGSVSRDRSGATSALSYTQAGGGLLTSDTVTRSQTGRVMTTVTDAAPAASATYAYDAPGRLIAATVPGHTLSYAFAPSGGCGAAANAGKNTNRTSVSDNGATPTTSCYNQADQLSASSDSAVGTPTYDAHGNTTALGAQVLTYDGSDRHMATTTGSTAVSYLRDATGRIIARTEAGTTVHYGYAGPGDSAAFTTDAANLGFTDRTIGLVGGATLTKRATGDVWNYPDIHGDVVATADPAGAKRGATVAFDPFGTTLSPTSATAPDGLADNSAGNFAYGWLGQAQRGTEHAPASPPSRWAPGSTSPAWAAFWASTPWRVGRRMRTTTARAIQ